jgi:AcrR family transcriptional regulator
MKNIANEMNISEPAIYRHFQSKIDILIAILSYFDNITGNIACEVFSGMGNSLNSIENFFTKLMMEFTKNPSLARVIFSEEIFQNDTRLSEKVFSIMKSHQKNILKVIKKGQNNGEIRNDIPEEHISMIIMGTFRLLITRWRLTNFSFELNEKGNGILVSIKKILEKENKL